MTNVFLNEVIHNMNNQNEIAPVSGSKRHVFLDALRGFALLGVCMANYPEFSLYTFQPQSVIDAMSSAHIDSIVSFLMKIFVDGKFYTLFSLLFGIGFSIIISNASSRGANGMKIFYRRMVILALIGCTHLMLIWSGDILLLYAVLGMILPLFRRWSDKRILTIACILLLIPILIDFLCERNGIFLAAFPYGKWWEYANLYGINSDNFGVWLRDAGSYGEVSSFLIQGAWERLYEFVDGNRYFKVLGLFMIGFVAGRHKIYADLRRYKSLLIKVALWGLSVGLPLSLLYAVSARGGDQWGRAIPSVLYAVSVYPLGFAYAALTGLFCMRFPNLALWRWFAAPGRMALTNYVSQSVIGMFLFYGIGFGFGASIGLGTTELVAIGVFIFQILFSKAWLSFSRFGPLEWIWRMLTYGKWLRLLS